MEFHTYHGGAIRNRGARCVTRGCVPGVLRIGLLGGPGERAFHGGADHSGWLVSFAADGRKCDGTRSLAAFEHRSGS